MSDATERDAVPNEPDAVSATEGDAAAKEADAEAEAGTAAVEPEPAEAAEGAAAAAEPEAVQAAEGEPEAASAEADAAAGESESEGATGGEPETAEAAEGEAAAAEAEAAEGDTAAELEAEGTTVRRAVQRAPFSVSHVADYYRRYPGEEVTFFTRIELLEPVQGYTLHISMPEALVPGTTQAPGQVPPLLGVSGGKRHLAWRVRAQLEAGVYEYRVLATVAPMSQEAFLRSTATISTVEEDGEFSAAETVGIAVSPKGSYLRYLPSLYEQDDLMGRFIMLFESFWVPIESRIAHVPLYFDPRMAPPGLLPWLASWLGLAMDERWPEERRRRLIRSAVSLYRRRGTRRGLREYLEILGEEVDVIEHFGGSFRLGPNSALGPEAILGTARNEQHTFTVVMHLPASLAAPEHASQVAERSQTVRTIIETDKPAHTGYTLRLEYDR